MKVDIICPLYNAEKYIYNLHSALINQEGVKLHEIHYVLTECSDNTEDILKKLKVNYKLIKKNEFSHSLTREEAVYDSKADIICFISQDVVIESNDWLEKLVKPIIEGEADATYSRQLTKYNNLEKYTREKNYPEVSFIKDKNDIVTMGLNTFFFSDASSAINRSVFIKLNGYDHKNLPINEDMYFAYKLIMNGYKIKYCADSIVYHSHDFTLKEIKDRYTLVGKFFKQNPYLDEYKTNDSGMKLAKYVLKRILKEHRIDLLFRYPFDMAARYFGMKRGKK